MTFNKRSKKNNQADKMCKVVLNIKRERSNVGALVPMKVFVNEEHVVLKNGENYRTKVPCGNTKIRIKMWGMTDNKNINVIEEHKNINIQCGLEVGFVCKKPQIKSIVFNNNYNEQDIAQKITLNEDLPDIIISDNNEKNKRSYINAMEWLRSNKTEILNKLKEIYMEYNDIDAEFCFHKIEGRCKKDIVDYNKMDTVHILYMSSNIDEFIDKFDDNTVFLVIQCGQKNDDDNFSFAFVNCISKEIKYLFYRF